MRTEAHDEFLELCAVSTSGQLTAEEQKKLDEHLLICAVCRETLREYELIVDEAIPGNCRYAGRNQRGRSFLV